MPTNPSARSFCNTRISASQTPAHNERQQTSVSRRQAEFLFLTLLGAAVQAPNAQAIGFKKELKKRKVPVEEYSQLEDGLKYYDLAAGTGPTVGKGNTVTVHFDCLFRGIDVVSSRSARLLGGNRVIAEPYTFIIGQPVKDRSVKIASGDSAGGLFSGAAGPKPPPALSTAAIGMKVGGKRSVIVPADLGYGDKGEQEIPPGASFELQIELLSLDAA